MPAVAPTVSINDPGDGQGGTSTGLSVVLGGGTYDEITYAWTVSSGGGSITNATTSTPTWTRADVTVQTLVTIFCDITVTDTADGTTADNFDQYQVFINPSTLPDAVAPTIVITDPGSGNEGTSVTLSVTLTGGTYDDLNYAWTVSSGGGSIEGSTTDSPVWTRPTLEAGLVAVIISLTVTALGTGTNARNGTSANNSDSIQAAVNDIELPDAQAPTTVTINTVLDGSEGTDTSLGIQYGNDGLFDGDPTYAWTVGSGSLSPNDTTSSTQAGPTWSRPDVDNNTTVSISVLVTFSGNGTTAKAGTSETVSLSTTTLVRNVIGTPTAEPPEVTITPVPDGDEGTSVNLTATLVGGLYDGDATYAWRVEGGSLNGQETNAGPSWTRPNVTSDTDYNIDLDVTVTGDGTEALLDSEASTSAATVIARVRNQTLPAPLAPTLRITGANCIRTGHTVNLVATVSGASRGTLTYAWTVSGGGSLSTNSGTTTVYTAPSTPGTSTVRCTVTATGTTADVAPGTDTRADTHTIERVTTPVAVTAPTVTITGPTQVEPDDDIDLAVELDGGCYDSLTYAWTVSGGGSLSPTTDDDTTFSAPSADGISTVTCTVTAHGDGTTGTNLDSDSGSDTHTIVVGAHVVQPVVAPDVEIDSVPNGFEGTDADLTVTLTGGTYDTLTYAWTVSIGTSADLTGADTEAPNWTRPQVTGSVEATISLTVTARGTGVIAENNTTRSASDSVTTTVMAGSGDNLPSARAPEVTIRAVYEAPGGYIVALRAYTEGGTYDELTYAWTATAGSLSSPSDERPVWTRPTVSAATTARISVIVTARGTGTKAALNTTATASDQINATVTVEEPIPEGPVLLINGTPVSVYAEDSDEPLTITDDIRTERELKAVINKGTYAKPARGDTCRYIHRQLGTTTDSYMLNGFVVHVEEFEVAPRHTRYRLVAADAIRALRYAVVNTIWKGDTLRDIFLDILADPDIASVGVTGHPSQADGDEHDVIAAPIRRGDALIRRLADLTKRSFFADERKRIRMNTLTEVAADITIDDNSDHLVGAIGTGADDDENFNEIIVTGPAYRGEAVREHLPVATDQETFTLTRPIFEMLQPNAGTIQTAGLTDSGAEWTYDQGGTVLTRAETTTVTGTSLTVDYYPIEFISETVRDTADIRRRGRRPDVRELGFSTREEAKQLAKTELDRYRILRDSITFRTTDLSLRSGHVMDTARTAAPALEGQHIVTRAEYADRAGNGYMEGMITASSRVDHDAYEEMFGDAGNAGDLIVETELGLPRTEIPRTITEVEALPINATAPSVTITPVPDGNEGTSVTLGLTLTGGIYDDLTIAWTVEEGQITGADTAAPVWTRPDVNASTDILISVTVTATGDGTTATAGTTADRTATTTTTVLDGDAAVAPSVVINAIPAGAEGTSVTLTATLAGGAYDDLNYAWTVEAGFLNAGANEEPVWTRPQVTAHTDYDVDLTVTALGTGTAATAGTSHDRAAATVTATVRNIVTTTFTNQAIFQSFFQDEEIGTDEGKWNHDTGGSTTDANTGPGTNNLLAFMHTETSE